MKFSNKAIAKAATSSQPIKAILPLVPDPEVDPLDKKNSVVYELRTVPGDANSAKYKKTARIINGTESVRTLIEWYKDISSILTGLNVTTFNSQIAIIRTMTVGTVCSSFDSIVSEKRREDRQEQADAALLNAQVTYDRAKELYDRQQEQIQAGVMLVQADGTLRWANNGNANPAPILLAEPDANAPRAASNAILAQPTANFGQLPQVKRSVQHLLTEIMPRKVLPRIKRYLRRECRKPVGMKVKDYSQYLFNINSEELKCLPPNFAANEILTMDELVDIILYGTPKSWQKEMDRQGFDPIEKTYKEVIDFMENIEEAEGFDGTTVSNSKNNNGKKPAATKKNTSSNSPSATNQYCMLHGQGNHSTEECNALKAEAKKLKGKKNSGSNNKSKSSGKKDWTKKADDSKKKATKELNVLIKEAVAAGLEASSNKRKSDTEDAMMMECDKADDWKEFSYSDNEDGEIAAGSVDC